MSNPSSLVGNGGISFTSSTIPIFDNVTDNSSTKQQQYDHDDDNITTTTKTPSQSTFTSSDSLTNTCQLPLGYIFTPLSPLSPLPSNHENNNNNDNNKIPRVNQEGMHLCLQCTSYLNPYCPYDAEKNTWTCTTCHFVNTISNGYFYRAQLGTTNSSSDDTSEEENEGSIVMRYNCIEYSQQAAGPLKSSSSIPKNNHHHHHHNSNDNELIMLVIDGNLPTHEIKALLLTLSSTFNSSNNNNMIMGLLIYTQSIHVYQVGQVDNCGGTLVSADIYSSLYDPILHDRLEGDKGRGGGSGVGGGTSTSRERFYFGSWDSVQICIKAYFGIHEEEEEEEKDKVESLVQDISSSSIQDETTQSSDGNVLGDDGTKVIPKQSVAAAPPPPLSSRRQLLKLRREARAKAAAAAQLEKEENDTISRTSISQEEEKAVSCFLQKKNAKSNIEYMKGVEVIPIDLQEQQRRRHGTGTPKRCTGEAVSYALHFISTLSSESSSKSTATTTTTTCSTGRILIFTNGCPNIGNGNVTMPPSTQQSSSTLFNQSMLLDPKQVENASHYYQYLGQQGMNHGIGIDMFCSCTGSYTSSSFGIPALQSLVLPSGGHVLRHDTFHEYQFDENMEVVLKGMNMSRAVKVHDYGLYDDDGIRPSRNGGGGGLGLNQMNTLNGCTVDLRMPSFMTLTHMNGPGEIIRYSDNNQQEEEDVLLPNEYSVYRKCASLAKNANDPSMALPSSSHNNTTNGNISPSSNIVQSTMTRIQMGRFDPRCAFSIMIQTNDKATTSNPMVGRYVYFQFVVRYIDTRSNDGNDLLITRVTTQRIATSHSKIDFLDSLNEDIIPIVLAKEAASRSSCSIVQRLDPFNSAKRGERDDVKELICTIFAAADRNEEQLLAQEARGDLDVTIHQISKAYRESQEDQQVNEFAFPPELIQGLKQLHHFRRGRILGPNLQSIDDRAFHREHLTRLSLQESHCAISPSVWSCYFDQHGDIMMDPVPAETLVLWSDRILATDSYDSMFIWSGVKTLSSKFDKIRERCKQKLLEGAKGRFPSPYLHNLTEGESMCRRFTTRLVPSHGDPDNHQIEHFPSLVNLSEESLQELRNKFRLYDDVNDPSFFRWFWKVVGNKFDGRDDGTSLCKD